MELSQSKRVIKGGFCNVRRILSDGVGHAHRAQYIQTYTRTYKGLIERRHHTVILNENPHLDATCFWPWRRSIHSSLILLYIPTRFPRHSHQFPGWEHFNRDGRSIYPHPLYPRACTQIHSLTRFNTHPPGERKASLVWSVIVLSSPPLNPSYPLCTSSAITIIRKITLQIPFNNGVDTHTEPTEEY